MRSSQQARHGLILELLSDGHEHHVEEFCAATGASPATTRRDLEFLESTGLLLRTHGGARRRETGGFRPSYADRMGLHGAEKAAIAREAVKLIQTHDTIALCNGTTTYYLARAICQSLLEVTVISNAIDAALEMAAYPHVRSILVGGEVTGSYTMGGFWGELVLKSAPRVDKTFLGADGISLTRGLTAYNPEDASMHSRMASLADQVIALVDHSKFGVVKLSPMLPLSAVNLVISDSRLEPETAGAYRQAGVNLCLAPLN